MSNEFKHKAIYGATKQGKTWLMKRLAAQLLKYHQKVLVFSGVNDSSWPRGVILTQDPDTFEALLKDARNLRAHVMMDEGAVLYAEINKTKHPTIYWFFMKGRHQGYTGYLATQYPTSIPRRNRINCLECYCFRLGDEESAKQVWADYGRLSYEGQPLWRAIMQLQPKQCLHITDGQVELILL